MACHWTIAVLFLAWCLPLVSGSDTVLQRRAHTPAPSTNPPVHTPTSACAGRFNGEKPTQRKPRIGRAHYRKKPVNKQSSSALPQTTESPGTGRSQGQEGPADMQEPPLNLLQCTETSSKGQACRRTRPPEVRVPSSRAASTGNVDPLTQCRGTVGHSLASPSYGRDILDLNKRPPPASSSSSTETEPSPRDFAPRPRFGDEEVHSDYWSSTEEQSAPAAIRDPVTWEKKKAKQTELDRGAASCSSRKKTKTS
ncbi:hypothetical protein FA10DRAFT_262764 [Acaromyces ingoldii]|uniref:Pal1-domain-containing protein n=1 Tax=Acaromyces ingoldii TaxID=215250 RepID=A0A316YBR7_9BASI|nr:hypothetical protein FA10DRAFT_262764 [Acaromyces ingoldii]PWN86967.1 hypothetical protein FA10DRAFT_262764 [Acaromyces ingoldii]